MINRIMVHATGDKSLSGVACLLRCCAGPSKCPVCVVSSLYTYVHIINQTRKSDYPSYLTFPLVSTWRMPPMGSLQLGQLSC